MNRQRTVLAGLGVFALVLGFLGAYSLGRPKPLPMGTEVVALSTVYPGQPLAGRVAVFRLPLAFIPTGAVPAYAAVAGRVATTTLYRGDPVFPGDVSADPVPTRIGVPKGMEGVVLSVQGMGLAGTAAGESVDIVATSNSPQLGIAAGQVLVPDAQIIGFFNGQGAQMDSFAASGGTASAVELAVTPAQASELARAGSAYAFVLDPWFLGRTTRSAPPAVPPASGAAARAPGGTPAAREGGGGGAVTTGTASGPAATATGKGAGRGGSTSGSAASSKGRRQR